MKDTILFSPKDAAPILGLSVATITRCVKNGAPVHRWGSTGRRYRIDVDEFRRWMERQGQKDGGRMVSAPTGWPDVDELARRRRASVRAV
jgi:excisionase family DNA binding protein